MAYPFEAARVGYGNLWREARVKPGADSQNADRFADKIIANEARYRYVQNATGVPWFFVAALHMRESSCNFDGVLHNGEKIIGTGRETRLVPAGHGPFATWEESAVDALKLKDLHRVQEWSIERMLYSAEVYNGLGYLGKVNSPYVWAGTTLEQTGKYIADHVWDSSAEDVQLGVAALLKRLAERRQDITAALQATGGEAPQSGGPIIIAQPPGTPDGNPLGNGFMDFVRARKDDARRFAMSGVVAFNTVYPDDPIVVQGKQPAAPATPSQPTSVKAAALVGAGGFILQLLGIVPPPEVIGPIVGAVTPPTTLGTMTTFLPAIAAIVGKLGGFSPLVGIGSSILDMIVKKRAS